MSAEDNCEGFTPDRSLGQFTTFTDLYNTTVTVRGSSLATLDAVWIQLGLMPHQRAMLEAAGINPDEFTAAAHLCREMAAEVRDALDSFLVDSWLLDSTEGTTDPCGPVPFRMPAHEAANFGASTQVENNQ